MAMLKSTAGHDNVSAYIKNYLEHGTENKADRTLGQDFLNITKRNYEKDWARTMDRRREQFGLTGTYRGMKRRTFYHFMISPDPRDSVDLETLRQLTIQWAREFFGDGKNNPGELGRAQVAIIYHDDNENHIPHAHIIVNNCNLDNFKALHITTKETKLLANRLQDMSKELGLSYFDNTEEGQQEEKEHNPIGNVEIDMGVPFLDKVERALRREEKYTWKGDLRNRISTALRVTNNEQEFIEELKTLGVDVRETRRDSQGRCDWIYTMRANPTRWSVRGYRLGNWYTRSGVLYKQHECIQNRGATSNDTRKGVNARIETQTKDIEQQMKTEAKSNQSATRPTNNATDARRVPEANPIRNVNDALWINEALDIQYFSDYDDYINRWQELLVERENRGDEKDAFLARLMIQRVRDARVASRELGFVTKEQRPKPKPSGQLKWVHDETGTHRVYEPEGAPQREASRDSQQQSRGRSR